MSYYDDDEPDCRICGVRDYGFEASDVRSTFYVEDCDCKTACVCTVERKEDAFEKGEPNPGCVCEELGCNCDQIKIQVKINRIWDKRCPGCDGLDWRPEWQVLKDGKVIATVPSENAADAVVEAEYPEAESDYDPDWESERGLRIAEGWGC